MNEPLFYFIFWIATYHSKMLQVDSVILLCSLDTCPDGNFH